MATGISKGTIGDSYKSFPKGQSTEPELDYAGKRTLDEIRETEPAKLDVLVENEDSPANHLIYGENLAVLRALAQENKIKGKVKLVYIDPPFATKLFFSTRDQRHAYHDRRSGAEFIEFIRERLIAIKELMAEDASIYLHLDQKMIFHIKLVMDEIFGARNFRNFITRRKCSSKNYSKNVYGNVTDHILFYTCSEKHTWNRPVDRWSDEKILKEYPYVDDKGRRHKRVPIHAPGIRNGETGKEWRGMLPPPGKHWQYTPARLEEFEAQGDVYWSSNNNPRRKVYLEDEKSSLVQDIWMDFRDAHNQNILVTGYPTEKNIDMLKLIVGASSDPGDIVLDAFCGSGATLFAAQELKRRWIGIDSSFEAIRATLMNITSGRRAMGDYVGKRIGTAKKQKSLFDTSDEDLKKLLFRFEVGQEDAPKKLKALWQQAITEEK